MSSLCTPESSVTTLLPPNNNFTLKDCENCSQKHNGTYGSGRFCSSTCAKKVGARIKWRINGLENKSKYILKATKRVSDEKHTCEGCHTVHNGSFGSGRFCSVHCARRVAASRKWDKHKSGKIQNMETANQATKYAGVNCLDDNKTLITTNFNSNSKGAQKFLAVSVSSQASYLSLESLDSEAEEKERTALLALMTMKSAQRSF